MERQRLVWLFTAVKARECLGISHSPPATDQIQDILDGGQQLYTITMQPGRLRAAAAAASPIVSLSPFRSLITRLRESAQATK